MKDPVVQVISCPRDMAIKLTVEARYRKDVWDSIVDGDLLIIRPHHDNQVEGLRIWAGQFSGCETVVIEDPTGK